MFVAGEKRAPQCLGHHLELPPLFFPLSPRALSVLLDYMFPINESSPHSLLQSARDFSMVFFWVQSCCDLSFGLTWLT